MSNEITKIVLTGGPCAGKTTALVRIIEHFTSLGFAVFTLPEVPTMFNGAGVNYLTKDKDYFYQAEKATLEVQMQLEEKFGHIAAQCGKPAIIVSDRGTMDISAYMSPLTWEAITAELSTNTVQLRDSRYDAVLHLVTAANGAEEFYTTANNEARTETIEQACELDRKLIEAWTGHPHLRVIDNCVDFEQKLHRVLTEISSVIGVPEPIEAERKYIVEVIGDIPGVIESEITQTYLLSPPEQEVRLRKRGSRGNFVYFLTTKTAVSPTERIETERHITPRQYITMLNQADPKRETIRKIRKNFVWEKQYFELDTYLQPELGISILEIDGVQDHNAIKFPPFLRVVKDITGDFDYTNYKLSVKKD